MNHPGTQIAYGIPDNDDHDDLTALSPSSLIGALRRSGLTLLR